MPLELKMVGSVGWLRFAISSLVKRHAAKNHELFIQQEIAEPHWLLHPLPAQDYCIEAIPGNNRKLRKCLFYPPRCVWPLFDWESCFPQKKACFSTTAPDWRLPTRSSGTWDICQAMDEFDDEGDVEETEFLDEAGEAGIQWDSPVMAAVAIPAAAGTDLLPWSPK